MLLYLFFKSKENNELGEVKYLYNECFLSSTDCKKFASIAFEGIFSNVVYTRNDYIVMYANLGNKKRIGDVWVSKDKNLVIVDKHKLNKTERLHHIKLSECKEVDVSNFEKIHVIWNVYKKTELLYNTDFFIINYTFMNYYEQMNLNYRIGYLIKPVGSQVYFKDGKFTSISSDDAKQVLCKELTEKEIARLKLLY